MEAQVAAGERDAERDGRAGARRARQRRLRGRRAAGGGPHAPAPALRLPAPAQALPALHAGDGRGDVRHPAGRLPRGGRGALRELRPRAHVRVRVLGRLDAAHGRRPVHPHRGDHPAPARQHRPAGRRDPGAARPRVDPGLDRHPDALQHPARATCRCRTPHGHQDLETYVERNSPPDGLLGPHGRLHHEPAEGLVAEREPRRTTSASTTCRASPATTRSTRPCSTCATARCTGFFLLGENPAVGSAHAKLHRLAMAKLNWLVVRDFQEIESASFWHDAPEIETGELATEEIAHRGLLPAGRRAHREGRHASPTPSACCSGTTRRSSRRATAARSSGSCTTSGAGSGRSSPTRDDPKDAPVLDLRWDYPTEGEIEEPSADAVLREISGWDAERQAALRLHRAEGRRLDRRAAAGSTAAATPTASTSRRGASRASEQSWVAPEWGWAWPANRRILYNRASADPDGKPWSERKRYVWWDAEQRQVDGRRRPRLQGRHAARLRAARGREGRGRAARRRAVHHAGRRARLAVRAERPDRRPVPDPLRAARVAVREPALRPAGEPHAAAVPPPRQPVPPLRRRAGRGGLPVRDDHLPPDRAPHRRRHVAHAALPLRAPARDVLRGEPRARRASAASSTAAGRRSSARARRSRRA